MRGRGEGGWGEERKTEGVRQGGRKRDRECARDVGEAGGESGRETERAGREEKCPKRVC